MRKEGEWTRWLDERERNIRKGSGGKKHYEAFISALSIELNRPWNDQTFLRNFFPNKSLEWKIRGNRNRREILRSVFKWNIFTEKSNQSNPEKEKTLDSPFNRRSSSIIHEEKERERNKKKKKISFLWGSPYRESVPITDALSTCLVHKV